MDVEYKISHIINDLGQTKIKVRFYDYSEVQHEILDEDDPYYDLVDYPVGSIINVPSRTILAERKYTFATYVKRANIDAFLHDEAARFGNPIN